MLSYTIKYWKQCEMHVPRLNYDFASTKNASDENHAHQHLPKTTWAL